MGKIFALDNRLRSCAEFVREGTRVADIGTDHAYLPIWLAKKGIIQSAVAADIRPLPLKSGEENIKKYGCENIVSVRLSDGLDNISSNEADDIVIAGMGAELITSIIDRAEWLKSSDKNLILQPMTRAYVLRKYLLENGFDIVREKACVHSGKYYTVLQAVYSGNIKTADISYFYIGELKEEDELSKVYLHQILKKLRFRSQGGKHDGKDTHEIDFVIEEIIRRFGDYYNDES